MSGLVSATFFDQLSAIAGFADNFPARFSLQQCAHSSTHQFVVVRDQYS